MNSTPLLEGQGLSKTFAIEGGVFRRRVGSVQALKKVSFQIARGETLAVVGGSGSGKSTLAKIITGLEAPDHGTLRWEGELIEGWSRLERAKRIQMIFQDPFASLNPKLSIGTQLREVVRLTNYSTPSPLVGEGQDGGKIPSPPPSPTRGEGEVMMRCAQLLEAVGLSREALGNYPFQFSGGQRQRVAIAKALALRPALLIADEPLSALDVTIQAHILELLRRLKQTHALTILFISHDLAVVDSFADRMIVLQNGEAVEEGPVSELLSKPKHPYTRALLDAVPRIPA